MHRNRLKNDWKNSIPKSGKLAAIDLNVTNNSNIIYLRVHRREGKERLLNKEWMLAWKSRFIDKFLSRRNDINIHVLMGTAYEDQAVKNCLAIYKVMDVNVEQIWRRLHRQSSVLGRLFKRQDEINKKKKEICTNNNGNGNNGNVLPIANNDNKNNRKQESKRISGSNNIDTKKKRRKINANNKVSVNSQQRLLSSFFGIKKK